MKYYLKTKNNYLKRPTKPNSHRYLISTKDQANLNIKQVIHTSRFQLRQMDEQVVSLTFRDSLDDSDVTCHCCRDLECGP